jgi:hypothetical protein
MDHFSTKFKGTLTEKGSFFLNEIKNKGRTPLTYNELSYLQ